MKSLQLIWIDLFVTYAQFYKHAPLKILQLIYFAQHFLQLELIPYSRNIKISFDLLALVFWGTQRLQCLHFYYALLVSDEYAVLFPDLSFKFFSLGTIGYLALDFLLLSKFIELINIIT